MNLSSATAEKIQQCTSQVDQILHCSEHNDQILRNLEKSKIAKKNDIFTKKLGIFLQNIKI